MATLKAVELENGQWVYVQVNEHVHFADIPSSTNSEVTRGGGYERKGGDSSSNLAHKAVDKLGDIIRAMSDTAAQALKNSPLGNVEKVTLEFGVTLGGEMGIPYITSGKAEGAVNVTVEFAPKKEQ
ncbi:MAG: CU044_2847 family protein [Thiofilum sp.]|uniref:CU044_2847 family protein n=1 Tax=Thiofilum sp. TaxID=2212733 RepID=UPI0025DBDF3B|nr:CU044_2847 family protein [Thiofilum sp.]MBK8454290.1 hypothetical protein [Thiofilum sp.]